MRVTARADARYADKILDETVTDAPTKLFDFSFGGRNVVRKCSVPGICPKPEPGTTHIPVSSSNAMQ